MRVPGAYPILCGVVDGFGDIRIQILSFFQNMIQSQLSNLRAHGSLRELRHRILGILNAVTNIQASNPKIYLAL